jgi:hypothetical protein
MTVWVRGAAFALVFASSALNAADATSADPEQTRLALAPLLAAANEVIPPTSSCHGKYGQSGKATLGSLLSMQIAYLYRGNNAVTGKCIGAPDKRCSVTIDRSFGEDVSSAKIDFVVHAGKLRPSSLSCVMTP